MLSIVDGNDAERTMRKYLLFLMGLAVPLTHAPVLAQVYKWTDASGKIHYSDRAGDGSAGQSTRIKVDEPAPVTVAPQVKDWREQEEEYKRRHAVAKAPERQLSWTASSSKIPVNRATSLYNQQQCELARNILIGKPELNHRSVNAPKDYKTAVKEADASCGRGR
jgi:hypothetical protein